MCQNDYSSIIAAINGNHEFCQSSSNDSVRDFMGDEMYLQDQ